MRGVRRLFPLLCGLTVIEMLAAAVVPTVGAASAEEQTATNCGDASELKAEGSPHKLTDSRRKSYCIRESNVVVDCEGHTLNGAPWWNNYDESNKPIDRAFRIVGDVQNVEIRNCKIVGYERGVEIGVRDWSMRKHDEAKLYEAFVNGASVGALEDEIRGRQTRKIRLVNLTIEGGKYTDGKPSGDVGVYVFPYASEVTFEKSSISNMKLGIYLDSGSLFNRILESHFKLREGGREAIAIDSSAYNFVVRNTFTGPGKGGVHIYKNCGEDLKPRFQEARLNKIRSNTFTGLDVGVWIGLRADSLMHNRKAGERFDDVVIVDGKEELSRDQPKYSWYCLDKPLLVPGWLGNTSDSDGDGNHYVDSKVFGQSIVGMGWLDPGRQVPAFLEDYPRYAYYREHAPDNVVRCNYFSTVGRSIIAADDHAFIQNNWLRDSGHIEVGSAVRSYLGKPVANVNVVGNEMWSDWPFQRWMATGFRPVDGATGMTVRSETGKSLEWYEFETCSD